MEKQKLTPEVIDAIKRVLRMLGRLIGYPEAPAKKFMDEDIEKVLAPEEIRALRQAIRILQDALGKYGYYIRPYYYGYRYPLIRPRPYAFYGYGYRYKIPGYYYRYPRLRKAIEAIMYDIDELMKIHDDDLLNELQESFRVLASEGRNNLNLIESCRLIESYKEGKEWDVILIKSGLSKNNVYYPVDTLSNSVSLFEGKKSYCDHPTKSELSERPERSVKEIVGWFDNVYFEDDAVKARFHVVADWLKSLMRESYENGKEDLIGFSIVGKGTTTFKDLDGRRVKYVESIDEITSVDVVTDPAAGGKIETLVASKRGVEMNEDIYEDYEEKDTLDARVKELEDKLSMQEHERNMDRIVESSNLPEAIKSKLKTQFKGRIVDPIELQEAVELERKTLRDLGFRSLSQGLGSTKLEVTQDERDRWQKAMDGMFEGKDVGGVPAFRSIQESFEVITGRKATGSDMLKEAYGFSPQDPKYVSALREATIVTSDWGQILGDSITRKMIKEYQLPQLNDWRRICSSIVSVNDYRSQRRIIMGRFPNLPIVAENATYQQTTKPTDDEVTYNVKKHGYHISLSEETLVNDDLNAVRRIPIDMGRAAARTIYDTIFGILEKNVDKTYDGKVLFHTDHNNLGNTALTAGELSNVRTAMMKQLAYGSKTERLGAANIPKILLVPAELEDMASRISGSKFWLMGKSGDENATSPNIHYGIQYIVVDTFTDTNDWYAIADPNNTPTIEVGFLKGRETPELLVQDQPNVGSVFFADKITYRVKIVFGYCLLDYRGMYKEEVP